MPRRSTLARLMQAVAIGLAVASLAWLVTQWPASPVRAVLGAVLIAFAHGLPLAAEAPMLLWAGRADPTPRPTAAELLRAWWAELLHIPQIFFWRLAFRWREPPDLLGPEVAGRRGVVFIHGFICNRGLWAPWMHRLRAAHHACIAVNLEPVFGSIDNYAPIVDAAVRQVTAASGMPPVLVCHSMGGLAARAWLRQAGDPMRVHRIVTIATPHHGTWLARFGLLPNSLQMRQGSPWLRALERDEAARDAPPFMCWYSHCDNIVFPPSTATLAAADNRLVPGPAHVELAFHPEVMEETLALVLRDVAQPSAVAV
jgi:triacylglycerol esterase/lipase EstA (alpha/beta hydrolase family)